MGTGLVVIEKAVEFLAEEVKDYISRLYGIRSFDRIFQISKNFLHHEMDRGAKLSGVKRI